MPGTSPGTTAEQVGGRPDGQITKNLSSPHPTNNSLLQNSDLSYKRITPAHERGGSRSSRNAGGDAVDAGGVGAITQSRGGSNRERWTSRMTNGAGAYGKSVWSWLSLLQSSFAEMHRPDRVWLHRLFAKRRRQTEFVSGESTP